MCILFVAPLKERLSSRIHDCMYYNKNMFADGWMDGWVHGWMDDGWMMMDGEGWMDGWMDGRMDG